MFCNSRRELKGTDSHSDLGSFRTDVQRHRRFFASCEWNKNRRDERQGRKIICRIRYKILHEKRKRYWWFWCNNYKKNVWFLFGRKYLSTMGTPRTKLIDYVKYISSQRRLRCLLNKRDLFLKRTDYLLLYVHRQIKRPRLSCVPVKH